MEIPEDTFERLLTAFRSAESTGLAALTIPEAGKEEAYRFMGIVLFAACTDRARQSGVTAAEVLERLVDGLREARPPLRMVEPE